MNDALEPARRSTPLALLHALPAILLLAGYLWLAISVAAWAVASTLFGGTTLVIVATLALLAPGGLFATARIIIMVIEAER